MEDRHIEIEELRKIEFEIFRKFIDICDKLNLKYYLLGGTLLGCIRHKGFIPWDDDIDVGMLRVDYETFIKEASKYLPEYYFLQTVKTDPECPINFAKLRDSRTTFIETSLKNRKMNHGVFMDIFPLDFYPEKYFRSKIFHTKLTMCSVVIIDSFYHETAPSKSNTTSGIRNKIIKGISHLYSPSTDIALKRKENLMKKFKSGKLVANICGAWGDKEIVPLEWYGEGITLQFEGLNVRVPQEYDKWLTQVYGDYMQLPSVEKRITHHYTEVIDIKKSYLEYTEK